MGDRTAQFRGDLFSGVAVEPEEGDGAQFVRLEAGEQVVHLSGELRRRLPPFHQLKPEGAEDGLCPDRVPTADHFAAGVERLPHGEHGEQADDVRPARQVAELSRLGGLAERQERVGDHVVLVHHPSRRPETAAGVSPAWAA